MHNPKTRSYPIAATKSREDARMWVFGERVSQGLVRRIRVQAKKSESASRKSESVGKRRRRKGSGGRRRWQPPDRWPSEINWKQSARAMRMK